MNTVISDHVSIHPIKKTFEGNILLKLHYLGNKNFINTIYDDKPFALRTFCFVYFFLFLTASWLQGVNKGAACGWPSH